jgi:hypothetical protein
VGRTGGHVRRTGGHVGQTGGHVGANGTLYRLRTWFWIALSVTSVASSSWLRIFGPGSRVCGTIFISLLCQ